VADEFFETINFTDELFRVVDGLNAEHNVVSDTAVVFVQFGEVDVFHGSKQEVKF
jgi:hypothetical protein